MTHTLTETALRSVRLFTLAILALCAALFAPAAQAKEPVLDIQVITSDKGITAWLVEDHSIPVISFQFAFQGAGAALDPENKQGLAQMASNTMDEGAGDLKAQDFQRELRNLVISLGFTASRDHFAGSLKTLSKNKERAFELLKLAVNEPRFDKDPVERMSKANQSRIRSSLSDPDWIAARLMNDVAFAGHPYALNSGGTLSTLNAITPADLKAFHKARLGRNNVMVAVSGDITPEEVRIRLDELFGDLPEASLTPPADLTVQNSGKTFVYERDMPQTLIEIMQPGIDTHDPDYHAAQVMNFILGSSGFGSRLTTEIREKRGLTYGIYSTFYNLDHLFGFTVSTSTKNENVPEMLSLIQKEFQTMLSDNVSKKELEDAKSYLIGSLPLSLTSTDKIAGLLLSLQLNGRLANYLELRENAIESVSVKDVRRVAERILTPENFTTVLVGKPEGLDNATPIKKIPNAE